MNNEKHDESRLEYLRNEIYSIINSSCLTGAVGLNGKLYVIYPMERKKWRPNNERK